MKNIGKFAVLGAVLAASVSAFATTIHVGSYATGGAANGNANTALNYAGYFAANGPTWAAIPSGAEITSGTNYSVAIGAGSPWVNAMPNTTWVSNHAGTNPASGPSSVDPNGYYTFTSSIGALAAGTLHVQPKCAGGRYGGGVPEWRQHYSGWPNRQRRSMRDGPRRQ